MTPREQARERQEKWFDHGRLSVRQAPMPVIVSGYTSGHDQLTGMPQEIASHENEYKHARKGWPYAAIRPIANRFAAQSLMAGRLLNTPAAARNWKRERWPKWVKQLRHQIELMETHPILSVLRSPNPVHVEWQLEWLTAASLQSTGKAIWWFNVDGKRINVWPLPAHWCTPVISPDGVIKSWLVQSGGTWNGGTANIPDDQIAYFSFPDPSNPFSAISPLGGAARTILNDDAIHYAQNQQFKGGHMPDHAFIAGDIINPDGTKERPEFTPAQRDELETRLRQMYGGPRNHGKFILLDKLISDVKRLSVAPTEMDYMNSMKITKNEIMQMFGVNPIIAGEIENANRASATIADENFTMNVINPMLEMVGQVLTRFVRESTVFRQQQDIVLFYEKLEARDPELESKEWQWAYDRAIVSDDDYRTHRLKMPPKKNGGGTARISPLLTDVVVDGDREPVQQTQPVKQNRSRKAMAKETFRTVWLKQHDQGERRLEQAVKGYLYQQADEIADTVANGGPRDASHLMMGMLETRTLLNVIRPGLIQAGLIGAGLEQHAFKFFIPETKAPNGRDIEQRIAAYLDEMFRDPMWADFSDHSLELLQELLLEGRGLDALGLSNRIRKQLREIARVRALRLARTETTNLLNAGADAFRSEMADQGIVQSKEWSTTIDKETRGAKPHDVADHVVMDGQTVPANGVFTLSDGEQAPFPGYYKLSAEQRVHCILPGTTVSGAFQAATRSLYCGKAIEIKTRSGAVLRVTDNHPVLTECGFVRAADIHKGDDLLRYKSDVESLRVPLPSHNQQRQPAIEDVFRAFSDVGSSEFPRAASADFHGDGNFINGDIEIVRPNWKLLGALNSARTQFIGNVGLECENVGLSGKATLGTLGFFPGRCGSSCGSSPRGSHLLANGSRATAFDCLPFDSLLFGSAASLDVRFSEDAVYDQPSHRQIGGNGIHGFSRHISPNDIFMACRSGRKMTTVPDLCVAANGAPDILVGTSSVCGNHLQGISSFVSLDPVISVRQFNYSGHVYDLQSRVGWIVADGIFVSNCRCISISTVFAEPAPDEPVIDVLGITVQEYPMRRGLCEIHSNGKLH